jgi:hypothetical protein
MVQRRGNYVERGELAGLRGVDLLHQLRRAPPVHPPPRPTGPLAAARDVLNGVPLQGEARSATAGR